MGHLCLKGVDGSIIGEAVVVPQGYGFGRYDGGTERGWGCLLNVNPLGDTGLAVPVTTMGHSGCPNMRHAYHTFEVLCDG